MNMNNTFEFWMNADNKSYSVIQINHWGKRDLNHTFIGNVVARWIPMKFVQRYVDKLLSLGYSKDAMSSREIIILTFEGGAV